MMPVCSQITTNCVLSIFQVPDLRAWCHILQKYWAFIVTTEVYGSGALNAWSGIQSSLRNQVLVFQIGHPRLMTASDVSLSLPQFLVVKWANTFSSFSGVENLWRIQHWHRKAHKAITNFIFRALNMVWEDHTLNKTNGLNKTRSSSLSVVHLCLEWDMVLWEKRYVCNWRLLHVSKGAWIKVVCSAHCRSDHSFNF